MACETCNGMSWVIDIDAEGNRSAKKCICIETGRVARYLEKARIPEGFRDAEIENYDVHNSISTMSQELALIAVKRFSEKSLAEIQGKGLILFGRCGVGKTHLAIGLLRSLIRSHRQRGFFCSSSHLLEMIRMSFEREDVSEWSLMAPVLDSELLILDDLGSGKITEYVQEKLAYILSERYNRKLTTIITTNYPVLAPRPENAKGLASKTLGDCIGDRAFSRIHEMCLIVRVEGHDFRVRVKHASTAL